MCVFKNISTNLKGGKNSGREAKTNFPVKYLLQTAGVHFQSSNLPGSGSVFEESDYKWDYSILLEDSCSLGTSPGSLQHSGIHQQLLWEQGMCWEQGRAEGSKQCVTEKLCALAVLQALPEACLRLLVTQGPVCGGCLN